MHQFRLAVATRCFGVPLIDSIKAAAKLGIPGIQLEVRNELRAAELTATGRRDLLHQFSEYGLKVSSAFFPLNTALYDQNRLDLRVNAIRDAMRFAYSLNASILCFRIGKIPDDLESESGKLLIELLSDLARHANHVGTSLAIIPTDDSAESLSSLLTRITTGPIGIDFDPAHFVMTGRDLIESLRTLHQFVLHVQLRDGTRGIDGSQETAVGYGNVDWVELMAFLGEMDYRGWITAIRNHGDDRPRDLGRGIKLIQRLLLGG